MDIESDRVAKARNQFFGLTVAMLAVLVISGVIIISSIAKQMESSPSPTVAIIDTESKTPISTQTLTIEDVKSIIETKIANYTATSTPRPSITPTGAPPVLLTVVSGVPKDATGYCWDGTFTYALYRDNACDKHNGVRYWWGLPSTPTLTLTPTLTYIPTLTKTPTDTLTPKFTPTRPPYSYGPGEFIVPDEIKPGLYKGFVDGEEYCYWSRLDRNGDVIVNDIVFSGQFYVEIQEGDSFFAIANCYVVLRYFYTPIPTITYTPSPTEPPPTELPIIVESPSIEPTIVTETPTP